MDINILKGRNGNKILIEYRSISYYNIKLLQFTIEETLNIKKTQDSDMPEIVQVKQKPIT